LFSMEIESGFLFRPERKAALAEILPAILHGLNARGECFVAVDECDTIALKLYPSLPRPPAVKDSDVPVRVRDLDVLLGSGQDSGLDLGIRMIVPHIDGHNFVRVIAEVADVDISLVKRALQHLLYYGCIVMTDIFQYSNIYATQPRVQLLLRSRELSGACLRYISGEVGSEDSEALASSVSHPADLSAAAGRLGFGDAGSALSPLTVGGGAPPLSVDVIFNLYNAFGAGTRTCDVCAQGRTADTGIDDRRFISFGIIHGILRRLHKYPVPVSGSAGGRGWGGLVDEAALARCKEAEAATLAAITERSEAAADGGRPGEARAVNGARRGVSPSLRRTSARATSHDRYSSGSSSPTPAGRASISAASAAAAADRANARLAAAAAASEAFELATECALQKRRMGIYSAALPLLDGLHSVEEICCRLCCSQSALEECLERHGGYVYVLK
jgi:hypothetical protein